MHIEQMWTMRETPDAKRTDSPTNASEIHEGQDVTVDDEPTKKLRLTLTMLSTFKILHVYLSNMMTNSVKRDVVGGTDDIIILSEASLAMTCMSSTPRCNSSSGISASVQDRCFCARYASVTLFVLFIPLWVVCGLELSEVSCISFRRFAEMCGLFFGPFEEIGMSHIISMKIIR